MKYIAVLGFTLGFALSTTAVYARDYQAYRNNPQQTDSAMRHNPDANKSAYEQMMSSIGSKRPNVQEYAPRNHEETYPAERSQRVEYGGEDVYYAPPNQTRAEEARPANTVAYERMMYGNSAPEPQVTRQEPPAEQGGTILMGRNVLTDTTETKTKTPPPVFKGNGYAPF